MNKYLVHIFCYIMLGSHAQQTHDIGVIIDSISVVDTDKESFALYLPTTFKSTELSPILFVFSPSGNGKNGVEVFKEVAEAYNYILVSSNNTRNGLSYERNFTIAESLFTHVFSSFNVKEKGIYLAGFSGASRLVTAIASLSGQIEGVIGCGSGFSNIINHKPTTKKFAYAGICGESDMFYQEMIDVKGYLSKIHFSNTLFTFDGNHQWPPSEQLINALEWLEIESVKNGNIQREKTEILKSYSNTYDFVKTIDSEKQPLLAYEHYERLLGSYKRFFTLDSIVDKMRVIQKSTPYAMQLSIRKELFEQERDLEKVFIGRFYQDYKKPAKVNMKWWRKKFQQLDRLKEDSAEPQMEKMLSRFRLRLFAMLYEKQHLGVSKPNPAQQVFCKELYELIYPNGPN